MQYLAVNLLTKYWQKIQTRFFMSFKKIFYNFQIYFTYAWFYYMTNNNLKNRISLLWNCVIYSLNIGNLIILIWYV